MEVRMLPERVKKRGRKKDGKKEAQSRPKGVMVIIGPSNVGAPNLPNGSNIHVQRALSTCSERSSEELSG